jgi:hypothetical protein
LASASLLSIPLGICLSLYPPSFSFSFSFNLLLQSFPPSLVSLQGCQLDTYIAGLIFAPRRCQRNGKDQ